MLTAVAQELEPLLIELVVELLDEAVDLFGSTRR